MSLSPVRRAVIALVAVALVLLSPIAVVATASGMALAGEGVAFAARPGGGGSFSSGRSSGGGSFGGGGSSRSFGSSGGGGGSSFGSSRSSSGFGSSGSTGSSGSSGGGFSSTSSGTSSSAGGGAFLALVFLVLVVVVFVYVSSASTSRARRALMTAQYEAVQQPTPRSASIDALRVRDPNLTEASILDRVRRMSDIIRDAWCAGDMRPARAFVSDGVFSRFQVQLALMRTEGLRNVMSDASVLYTTLEAVSSLPPLDVVHVRFTAQARDKNLPLASTPEQIRAALASTPIEPYTEIWTLVRRQGAQTRLAPEQVGKACPSCGAPLDPAAEMIQCAYCKALVCSAEHDWVLSEITQVSEWFPESHDEVQGLAELREDDPGTARETLEDRASYLFWKWVEAGRTQTAAPVRKCATPDFVASRANFPLAGGTRNVAVGAADAVLCDPGPDGDVDAAYVRIYWSAEFQPGAPAVPMQTTARLVRKAGVSSQLSMTSLVCRNCGAPLRETDSTACDHCHAELAAGDQAWVLDALLPPGTATPRRAPGTVDAATRVPDWMVPNVIDPRERDVLFTQMAALMASDGTFGKREKRLLRACARRWAIPDERVLAVFSHPQVVSASPMASASPGWFLAGLVSAALIDGKLDRTERAMLERARTALGVPPAELERQIQACQQRMASGA